MQQRQAVCLSVSHIVCVCASSYPVCVQLCLHGGDIAPYRRLLLQLLTFKPQPVEQLLQRHVEPLPRGHLWVQVGPWHTNTSILLHVNSGQTLNISIVLFCRIPGPPSLTSCWGSFCAGRSSAGSYCSGVSGAERRLPNPPARSQSSGRSHPGSDTALCGCQSLPGGPGKTHTVSVSGKSKSSKFCLSAHFIFLVIAAIFQEFTFSLLECSVMGSGSERVIYSLKAASTRIEP